MKKMQKLMLMLIKFQEKELKKLNEADGMIFQTETQLKELGEIICGENKVAIEIIPFEAKMSGL
jgi:molecular chaperone DnaK